MVHAFEADDLAALGESASQTRGIQHRLGTSVAQPHLIHAGHGGDDFLGQTCLVRGRQREYGAALLDEIDHGLGHARRPVAEYHRPQS